MDGGVASSGVGSRSNSQGRRPIREGFFARRLANGASTVVEMEDAGSLIGTSRKVAGLGEITGTQACERRIKSNGSRHLRRTRKHSGGRRLKQEFLGDFEVGNGDFASWRRRSERWRLRRIYSLLAKVQLRFVEAGWRWHWRQRADHNHSFSRQHQINIRSVLPIKSARNFQ